MTRAEMITELREVLGDTVADYKWSDSRLLQYLAEGQDKFCEETGFFRDFTNYTVTAVEDQAGYAISDRIIEVLSVWNGGVKLGQFVEDDRAYPAQPGQSFNFETPVAGSFAWQADRETDTLTLYPTPDSTFAGTELTLRVWRYSQSFLADTDVEPELPARFQRACIEWAAYKALGHHDAEQQDPVKAGDHLNEFGLYVNDGRAAVARKHAAEIRVGGNPLYMVR